MYGVQVNVGTPATSQWKWVRGRRLNAYLFFTREEAEAQMRLWYPVRDPNLYRVEEFKCL